MAAKKKGGLANFGGKQAAPFGSGGARKKSSTKTAKGTAKKTTTTGRGGGRIYDPDGKPNSGDEYRMIFGKKVPVK